MPGLGVRGRCADPHPGSPNCEIRPRSTASFQIL